MALTRLTTMAWAAAIAVVGGAASASAALIDDFNDTSLAEYTTTTILDNDPPAAISFSSPSGSALATKTAGTGAEQVVLLRSDFSLGIGQKLRVDTSFPATQASYGELGLVVSKPPVSLVRDDYVAVYLNPNQTLVKSIVFNGTGAGANSSAPNAVVTNTAVTGLFISRTAANTFQVGYSIGATDTVQGTYNPTDASDWTSIGLYSDIRAVISVGSVDNLRITPEPATGMMALSALGLVAGLLRRRSA